MNLSESITRQQQKLARLERHLAIQRLRKRKAETRKKIELGGLVIKANLDQYPKSIILGALMDVCKTIETDEAQKDLFKIKGEAAFMGYDTDEKQPHRNQIE